MIIGKKHLDIKLSDGLYLELKTLALKNGVPMAHIVRKLIKLYVKHVHEKEGVKNE